MVYQIFLTALQAIGIYLLIDFVTGFFHWAQDSLGKPTTPFWGAVFVAPNELHHVEPGAMNKIHWFRYSLPIYGIIIVMLLFSWITGHLGWQGWFAAFVGLFSQQAHRWTHTPRKALPPAVIFMQRIKVLQGARHHWKHHINNHITHFCVVTPWVNPVMDRLHVWRFLERLFVPVFGAPRRPDLQSKTWYRDKAFWN